jgi:putative spermidine/putrescine transport system permease protein
MRRSAEPPAVVAIAPRWGRHALRRRATPYLLLAPALLVLGVFFFYPLWRLLLTTFYVQAGLGGPLRGPTLANYTRFLSDPFYRFVLGRTLRVAGLVTLIALLLGYPVALDLSRRPRRAALLTVLVVLPLAISLVVRGIGWIILTAPRGTLALAAQFLHLRPEPFGILYSETAIVIGLTNVLLPFMVLSLHGALATIDPMLARAAADLGARPLRTLVTVILPLSLPGVVAGSLIVFTLAASFFVIPAMLGGDRVRVLSGITYDQGIVLLDLPFAGATAVILFAVVITTVILYQRVVESGRWRIVFQGGHR